MHSASDSEEEEPAEILNSDSDSDTEITALRNIQRLTARQAENRDEVEVIAGPSRSHPNPSSESSRAKRRRLDNEQKEFRKQRLVDAMKLYESQRTDIKNKLKKSQLSAYDKLKEAISKDYPGKATPTIRILFFQFFWPKQKFTHIY